MATKHARAFSPEYCVAPGETLRETLDTLGLSQADLAERTGRPKKTINEIIQAKAAITPETALQFERVLGVPASLWINLEHQYRTGIARAAEREELAKHLPWMEQFPLRLMIQREWVTHKEDRVEMLREVLRFFGVASPNAWTDVWDSVRKATAYRQAARHKQIDFGAVAAWLRQGEIEGRARECKPFDATKFKSALREIRGLTTADPQVFCKRIQELCADAGVAVVFVPELPRTRLFGAARWIAPDKALIQLSLFLKRDDQLWFSFFHEAAHILLHGRRDVFIDGPNATSDQQEAEANTFARNILITPEQYAEFVRAADLSRDAVVAFAKRIALAPGIVVGRLQHEKLLEYGRLTDLFRPLKWSSE
jgi:HTH-type transcriptional regulator / antitoxin HigA